MKTIFGFSLLVTLALSVLSTPLSAAYRAHYRIDASSSEKILVDASLSPISAGPLLSKSRLLRSLPYYIGHGAEDLAHRYEEWEFSESQAPLAVKSLAKRVELMDLAPQSSELRVIRAQGPTSNRINLTIIGDGYTLAEKEKFFSDVERTVRGLFETKTFQSYLPLFNVYAVYVESAESGIGDGRPKRTAFRLYRDPAGSKRAIMPGDESAMSRAIRLAPATDYPIVLANDEYYGGLGGRWAISTSSPSSGLIVLRHELGHNFGEVGEEYDNGYVYSGANSSRSANVPWKHWIEGQTEVHEAKLLTGDYVWKNLSSGAYQASFSVPTDKSLMQLELSTVGWESPSQVAVMLNGVQMSYDGVFHKDRSFFTFAPTSVRPGSSYQLKIEERVKDGDNVLGFALAYAMSDSYNFTPNKVGAFASYDARGSKSYRPTHDSCLMKDMRRESFCAIDQENMWLKFLARVSLIDGLEITKGAEGSTVKVSTPGIEGLDLRWFKKNGFSWTELSELRGLSEWTLEGLGGNFRVEVALRSPEIRLQKPTLQAAKEFKL